MPTEWPITEEPHLSCHDNHDGYGSCACCGESWKYGKWHDTPHGERHACFPLCESCWSALSIVQRMPYYAQLVADWERMAPDAEDYTRTLRDITEAVLAGK